MGNPINRVDPSGEWWWGGGQKLYDHSFYQYHNQNLHVRIQAYWMEGRPGQIHAEYVIPGTNLPVDLLDSVSGEMWEIKPWADRNKAWSELEPRIYAMIDAQRKGLLRGMTPVATPYDWVNYGPDTWSPGISFPFDIYIGTDETGMYDFYAGTYEAGVIAWWKVNRDNPRQVPYPIYVPWDMKKNDRNVRSDWKTGELTPAPAYAAAITGFIFGCLRVIQWGVQGFECVSTGVCQFSPQ